MIDFPCKCGYMLSVPQDMAGLSIQCPECKLLQDVPLLSDLASLETDGTFKLDAAPTADDPKRMAELERAFLPRHTDDNGEEYDLRPTIEDIRKAGTDDAAQADADHLQPGAPKYDPVTGELIVPMAIKLDNAPQAKPAVPGKRTLNYASQIEEENRPRFVPLALFRPGNLVVMCMVFLLHLWLCGMALIAGFGLLLMGLLTFLPLLILLSHYVNVLEDIGPNNHDELPPPLRMVGWWEDMLRPVLILLMCLMLAYLPFLI